MEESPLDLNSIKAPVANPSVAPDRLTIQQQLDLSPKRRNAYDHHKLVERLDIHIESLRTEIDCHKSECNDKSARIDVLVEKLNSERIAHEVLKTTRRGDRWKDAAATVIMVVGAGFISSFPKGDSMFAFGWALLILSAIYQLGRACLNTP